MGTPDFAVATLKALFDAGHHIVGVITTADKKAGRGKKLHVSSVKQYALDNDIPVLTPLNLKDPEFLKELKAMKPDLQIVVAFRMLPANVWQLPPLGTFNLHASLLPQYRGAAPINHAIINGEKESGVSTFFLDKEIDTGRVIMQRKFAIPKDANAGDLHDALMELGAGLVLETVDLINRGEIKTVVQEDLAKGVELKAAPKIFKEDGLIDWNFDAQNILNKIKGLSPYPSAWTKLVNMHNHAELSMKIFSASISETKSKTFGALESDEKTYLKIHCSDYCIDIQELQLQGKKRMKTGDFLRGFSNLKDWSCISG